MGPSAAERVAECAQRAPWKNVPNIPSAQSWMLVVLYKLPPIAPTKASHKQQCLTIPSTQPLIQLPPYSAVIYPLIKENIKY